MEKNGNFWKNLEIIPKIGKKWKLGNEKKEAERNFFKRNKNCKKIFFGEKKQKILTKKRKNDK